MILPKDNKVRKLKLTGDEITEIIECLEREPHNVFSFMRYDIIVNKLKKARDK